jgi:FixJ family two-component response regulator
VHSDTKISLQSNIFLVDDDPAMLLAVGALLSDAGYRVDACDRPEALLSRLSADDRGCVVLDLKLPGLTRQQLLRALVDRGIALPVIFLTLSADVLDAIAAMKQGAVDFLPKPIEPTALLGVVEHALREDARLASRRRAAELARARWATLSPREQDVCRLFATGMLNKQIAAELGTAEGTVQAQRARALKKLGAFTVLELVRLMVRAGEDD